MFISKVIECISSKVSPIGTLYKESQNGVKVYRYIDNSGKVKLSSFLPDGRPFKTITRQNIDDIHISSHRVLGKSHGHCTNVQNHQTGVLTKIRNIETQYDQFTPLSNKDLGVVKEYSLHSTKNGNSVGKLIYVEEFPTKGIKINAEYDSAGNIISRESNEFSILA